MFRVNIYFYFNLVTEGLSNKLFNLFYIKFFIIWAKTELALFILMP